MTRQRAEVLLLDDQLIELHACPLQAFTEPRGLDLRNLFPEASSSLWRRYQGIWEIHEQRLYLVGLLGGDGEALDPSPLFRARRLPVFADWFTGRLQWDEGERLFAHWMGWADESTHRRFLYLRDGCVVGQRRMDRRVGFVRRHALAAAHYRSRQAARRAGAPMGPEPCWSYTRAGFRLLGIEPAAHECTDPFERWTPADQREWFEDIAGALSRPGKRELPSAAAQPAPSPT